MGGRTWILPAECARPRAQQAPVCQGCSGVSTVTRSRILLRPRTLHFTRNFSVERARKNPKGIPAQSPRVVPPCGKLPWVCNGGADSTLKGLWLLVFPFAHSKAVPQPFQQRFLRGR